MKAAKQLKKVLCIGLASGLILGCLTGCGDEKASTAETPVEVTSTLQETEEHSFAIETEEPSTTIETEEPSMQPEEVTNETTEEVPEDITPADVQHDYRAKDFDEVEFDPDHITDEWVRKGLYYFKCAQPDEIIRYEFIREDDYDIREAPYALTHYAVCQYDNGYFDDNDRFFVYVFNELWDELDIRSDVFSDYCRTDVKAHPYQWHNEYGKVYAIFLQTEEDLAKGDNVWSFYVGQEYLYDRYQ